MIEWLSMALLLVGAFFFFAGTVGLLRFPDVYSRLHALAQVAMALGSGRPNTLGGVATSPHPRRQAARPVGVARRR